MKAYYMKYKEVITYIFFGGLTTAVNWFVYFILVRYVLVGITISNVSAWISSVIFAYVTNKMYVFESKEWSLKYIIRELSSFIGARLLSGLIEMGGLPLLYYIGFNQSLFGVEGFPAKIALSVVVVILNYFFSKWFIFRKKDGV